MMGSRDVLKVQGNFNTANTIFSLSENLLITNLCLEASLKKKSNLVYFMDFIIVLFILYPR